MDYSHFIQEVRKHVSYGHKHFQANTPLFLEKVRNVIDQKTSPEQKIELISLEKELVELNAASYLSFPGSSACSP